VRWLLLLCAPLLNVGYDSRLVPPAVPSERPAAAAPPLYLTIVVHNEGLVRGDDLERTYDLLTVRAAASKIAASTDRLPEYVALESDFLSLSDCAQAFTAALAGRKTIAVRTMLGPARPAPPAQATLNAADVAAAAKSLKPLDALPATVAIGNQSLPLETYLHAAARVLAGEKGEFTVPPLRRPGPDPARWTVKPARRR